MSTREPPQIIEDEPYEGLYRGESNHLLSRPETAGSGHLPDRFDLAEILKKTRERMGLSLDEVSELTRVRRAYLEAFEQAAYDILPPRAFAIGYVKAYAKALGLDEESLADMYKRDASEPTVRLHAPSGASLEDVKPNYRAYILAGVGLVAAVGIWNVVQHKPLSGGQRAADSKMDAAPWKFGVPNLRDGMMQLTQAAPAPQDQDVPALYVTPGLEEGFASVQADSNASSAAAVPVIDVLQMRKAFNPQGAVYGAQPSDSTVTIQAKRSVNLIVRDAAGTVVVFGQQLGAGEAYRLPAVEGQSWQIEVSDIKNIDVFYNGEYAGAMDAVKTSVGALNAKAAQMSAVLDSKQAQAGTVAAVYTTTPKPEAPTAAPRQTEPIPYLPAVRPPAPVVQAPVAASSASVGSASASSVSSAPAAEIAPVPPAKTPSPTQ